MVLTGQLDKLRAGDTLGNESAFCHIYFQVIFSMENERGDANRRKDVPDINLGVCLTKSKGGTWTCAHTEEAGPPLLEALVVGNAWGQHRKVDNATPLLLNLVIPFLSSFRRRRPRIFRVPYPFCEYAVRDQRGGTLRVSGGEQNAHIATLGCTHQRRAFGADSVHHRSNVIHPLFESG